MSTPKPSPSVAEPRPATVHESETSVSRRRLIATGAGAAAAAALGSTGVRAQDAEEGGAMPEAEAPSMHTLASRESFVQPMTIHSRDGVLEHELVVVQKILTILCGQATYQDETRMYDGRVPGPTLVVDPGDRMDIKLNNMLPPNPDQDQCEELMAANQPNCFNSTNLHTHGLHVSPLSICQRQICDFDQDYKPDLASDDVLFEVKPGETQDYCIWLPTDHAPGTHWYHAHRHGSTALQVSNGMAGALIVREPDNERLVPQDKDYVWMVQEVVGQKAPDIYTESGMASAGGFLVNGVCKPTLSICAGELVRWRFVNATSTPRGLMRLRLVKCDDDPMAACDDSIEGRPAKMNLVAVDGISFWGKAPQPVEGWDMGPGNRADFLVKLPKGKYKVVKDKFSTEGNTMASALSTQVLAYVEVQEGSFNDPIPTVIPGSPPDYLRPITSIDKRRPDPVVFNAMPGSFTINNLKYERFRLDYKMKLGSTESWTLQNPSGSGHPFHIHINPFQLVGDLIDPKGPDDSTNWRWWDTITIPRQTTDDSVQIWHRFTDYHGAYVIHCHILIHEDQGMMQNVAVVGDGVGPCRPLRGRY